MVQCLYKTEKSGEKAGHPSKLASPAAYCGWRGRQMREMRR